MITPALPAAEHTYPWRRVYSQDYTAVLWDSDKDPGTAEEYVSNSGYNWLPVAVDYAVGWRHRWSGRCEMVDGEPCVRPQFDYLKHLMVPINPYFGTEGGWTGAPAQ